MANRNARDRNRQNTVYSVGLGKSSVRHNRVHIAEYKLAPPETQRTPNEGVGFLQLKYGKIRYSCASCDSQTIAAFYALTRSENLTEEQDWRFDANVKTKGINLQFTQCWYRSLVGIYRQRPDNTDW